MIETAIITLNWKANELTRKAIESLKDNIYDYDKIWLIIVDQEVDETAEDWKKSYGKYFGRVDVICNKENLGVPKAYNQGMKLAMEVNPKYIIIMNNDIEFLPNCYEELKRCAEKDSKIGIVGGKALMYGENPERPKYFGMIIFKNGTIIGKEIEVPIGAPDCNIDVDTYCVGFACALIKTEVLKDIGLFDENYSPCDYEDTDLCFAARAKGWKVISCVPAKYYHLEGGTFKKHNLYMQLKSIFDRNRKYFAKKWEKML